MPRSNKKSRIKGLSPKLQLIERENRLGGIPKSRKPIITTVPSSSYFWDDRSAIEFQTYNSSSNTWLDNLMLYVKFSNDTLVSKPSQFSTSYQEGYKAFYYSNSFLNRCSLVGQEYLVSGSVFVQTSLEDFDSRLIKTVEQAESLAFTDDNLGLNFNAFGPIDRTPKLYFNDVDDAEDFNRHAIFTTEDQIDLQGTDLSFSLWFKCDRAYNDGESILITRNDEFEIYFQDVAAGQNGFIVFSMGPPGNNIFIIKTIGKFSSKFADWVHVVATYVSGANELDLFVNGTNDYSTTSGSNGTFAPFNSTELIYFGTNPLSPDNRWGGLLNEIAIFDKALSAEEVEQIYNCRSSLTLPEQGGVVYPIGLNTQSEWITSTEFTSSMIIPGARTVHSIADNFVDFSKDKSIGAFEDYGLPEVDGKSTGLVFFATGSSVIDAGEGFQQPLWDKSIIEFEYEVLTTSSVGYRSASNGNSEGLDFAMMYWNQNEKTFKPVGSGRSWDYYQDVYDSFVGILGTSEASQLTAQTYLTEKAVGFLPFVPNVANGQFATYMSQTPVSDFGFPFDDKYHVPFTGASSSILIPLKDKITQPFILEKVVVEFSCSHFSRDYWAQGTGGAHGEAINTFFILNQRKMKGFFSGALSPKIELFNGTVEQTLYTTSTAATTSSLELVSFNQFAFLAAPTASIDTDSAWIASTEALREREIQYYLCGQDNDWERIRFDYTGSIALSGTINLSFPTQNKERTIPTFTSADGVTLSLPGPAGSAGFNEIQYPGTFGGRTGLSQYSIFDARNLLRNAVGIERNNYTDKISNTEKVVPKLQQATPYILQPTDNLIFGFQGAYIGKSSYTDAFPFTSSSVNRGPTLTILPGKFKVRLYGSNVVEGKEYHDTLDQDLTTNSIHEVIE